MKEQMGDQDDEDVLPTIKENKYYPRRTLEYAENNRIGERNALTNLSAEELHAVLTNATDDSPDLGPPPVAHFTDEDPIKFDPKPANENANDDMDLDQKDEEVLPATVSVNLETRRKRRDSSKLDLRKMSVFQSPEEIHKDENNAPEPSKMGRKRKLSATAEETNGDAGEKDCRDDFRFSRRGGDRENRQPLEPISKQNSTLDMLIATERKALGDSKPLTPQLFPATSLTQAIETNTSPKKVQRSDSKSDTKKLEFPKEAARNRVRERKSRAAVVNVAPMELNDVETADIQIEEAHHQEQPELPPKTPAGLDLASPTSTEPSAARQEPKDTPPPGELGAANSDTSAAGRPSRRARSQVNYAEPSLVSKMRRPTKDLVDAVVDGRRSSGAQSDQTKSASNSTNPLRTVVIKRERPEDAHSAKSHSVSEPAEPHSPLSSKTAAAQLASETQMKEYEDKDLKDADEKPTKSASAMKDLLSSSTSAASSRRKTSSIKDSSTDTAGKDRPDLAIFDFNNADGSSQPDGRDGASSSHDENAEQIMKRSRALAAKTAASSSSRRHSSVVSTSMKDREGGERATSTSKSVAFSDESNRAKAPRHSKSSSTAAEGRTDRSSTRRRSMMV